MNIDWLEKKRKETDSELDDEAPPAYSFKRSGNNQNEQTILLVRLNEMLKTSKPPIRAWLTARINDILVQIPFLEASLRAGSSPEISANRLLNASEASKMLNIPVRWLQRHVKKLPHRKMGRYVRFPERELLKWVEKQQNRVF